MKKFLIILTVLVSTAISATAQGTIQKAYAFVQVIMPGNIMVDENGHQVRPPLNISRFIYIECKGTMQPKITSVQYKNENIKVAVYPVTVPGEHIGIKKGGSKPVTITASAGNSLWKLELQPPEKTQINKTAVPNKKIIIKEYKKGKYFKFTIDREIELQSPMSV